MHVLPKMMMQDDLHSVDALVGMRPDVMTPTYVQDCVPGRAVYRAGLSAVQLRVATTSHASWSE